MRKPRFRNEGAGKGIKQQLDPETLQSLYVDQHLSQSAIARTYGCSPQFVSLLLKEYGIERATPWRERTSTRPPQT